MSEIWHRGTLVSLIFIGAPGFGFNHQKNLGISFPPDFHRLSFHQLACRPILEVEERTQLRGAMTPLMDRDGNLLETGLVEQAVDFVRRNTPVHSRLEDGARRVDIPTYPEEAIRETIVNALIHRDYLLSDTDIELAIYEDRLEVISPGKLPNGITPERMRLGTRAARNSFLKDFMRDYGYLEHMGMGVPRKIIKEMKEHNGSDPELIEENERFTVRLFSTKPPSTGRAAISTKDLPWLS